MKKFEDELKNGPVMIDRDNVTGTPIYDEGTLIGHFKNWKSPEYVSKLKLRNEQLDRENLALHDKIANLEVQLDSQQPEVPEVPLFIGEWFKSDNLENLIDTWYNHTADLPENVKDYLDSLGEDVTTSEYCYKEIVHLIARAKLDGYTVAKEKKFLLKHKSLVIYDGDCEESDVDELYLNAEGNFTIYPYNAKIFTQSEIDSMETGSYEQIEVEE